MVDLKQVMAGKTPNQNLINQNKFSPLIESPGFYKGVVIDVLSIASALLFGFTYYRYLDKNLSVWWLLAALALWGVLSVLQVFLARKVTRRLLVMMGESIAILVFFW